MTGFKGLRSKGVVLVMLLALVVMVGFMKEQAVITEQQLEEWVGEPVGEKLANGDDEQPARNAVEQVEEEDVSVLGEGLGALDCERPRNMIEEANCGTQFLKYYNGSHVSRTKVRVAFYGKVYGVSVLPLRRISGCPVNVGLVNGPQNPGCIQDSGCRMFMTKSAKDLEKADVVIVTKDEAIELTKSKSWDRVIPKKMPDGKRRYRVLYVREAEYLPVEPQQQVDFVMGIYYWNGLLNPNFFMRPVAYVHANKDQRRFQLEHKKHMAMSLISNCEPTHSVRGKYIDALVKELGKENVHQYGKCGDGHRAPSKPLQAVADLASQYMFYLAFENTIVDGYVTEKLFKTLSFGTIPVYMGAPDVLNITRKKSFINVMDFASPRDLAQYLVYLSKNKTAYEEYHAWRKEDPLVAFESSYLDLVSHHVPGKIEYNHVFSKYKQVSDRKVNAGRVANCCRLCNREYLEYIASQPRHFIESKPWNINQIKRNLYLAKKS